MQIKLQAVKPTFLEPAKIDRSQLWNQPVDFENGQRVQVVAPSGSGKTSFIHFLYGLRKDYTGSILYDGKDISHFNAEDFSGWRQHKVSVVFQDMRLFLQQTVMENLEIKRVLSPYHQKSRITDMATRLGIGNKLDKKCGTCSYGEQQRIAIIRSLQQPFDFLLLDEPFSHLDEQNRSIAMQLIEEEATERKAAIILADLKPIEYFKPEITLFL